MSMALTGSTELDNARLGDNQGLSRPAVWSRQRAMSASSIVSPALAFKSTETLLASRAMSIAFELAVLRAGA